MKSTKEKAKRAAAGAAQRSESLPAETRRADRVKRENFKLPERIAKDLERISLESGITKTEVVRQGIALMRVCWDESKVGNRLVVQNAAGDTVKELILP